MTNKDVLITFVMPSLTDGYLYYLTRERGLSAHRAVEMTIQAWVKRMESQGSPPSEEEVQQERERLLALARAWRAQKD